MIIKVCLKVTVESLMNRQYLFLCCSHSLAGYFLLFYFIGRSGKKPPLATALE